MHGKLPAKSLTPPTSRPMQDTPVHVQVAGAKLLLDRCDLASAKLHSSKPYHPNGL